VLAPREYSYSFIEYRKSPSKGLGGGSTESVNKIIIKHIIGLVGTEKNRAEQGKRFFKELALAKGMKESVVVGMLQGFAESTVKNYNFGWRRFWRFLYEDECHEDEFNNQESITMLFIDFIQWLQDEEEEGAQAHSTLKSFTLIVSSVSTMIRIIFGFNVSDDPRVKLLMKAFKRTHPQLPKYSQMWNAGMLLDYFRNHTGDFTRDPHGDMIHLDFLQGKVGLLLMFFCYLRPIETAYIDLESWEEDEDGMTITSASKSENRGKIFVYIPKLLDSPTVSPYTAMKQLREVNIKTWPECPFLFANLETHTRLSRDRFRQKCKVLMREAGINTEKFGIYTVKHSSVTYLIKRNISRAQIEDAMHYKTRSTLRNNYAVVESMKPWIKLLAQATSETKEVCVEVVKQYKAKSNKAKMQEQAEEKFLQKLAERSRRRREEERNREANEIKRCLWEEGLRKMKEKKGEGMKVIEKEWEIRKEEMLGKPDSITIIPTLKPATDLTPEVGPKIENLSQPNLKNSKSSMRSKKKSIIVKKKLPAVPLDVCVIETPKDRDCEEENIFN
jgi:hypothetical protein